MIFKFTNCHGVAQFAFITIFFLFQLKAETNRELLVFADSLERGATYKGKYVHPLTQDTLYRTIQATHNGICIYSEEMPGGGKMICHYKAEDLSSLAQYYRDLAAANSASTELKIELGTDSSGKPTAISRSTYYINGKKVDNPLEECLQNGTCKIEGYAQEHTIETAPGVSIESLQIN